MDTMELPDRIDCEEHDSTVDRVPLDRTTLSSSIYNNICWMAVLGIGVGVRVTELRWKVGLHRVWVGSGGGLLFLARSNAN